jgi:ankyrin repeat protein
MEALLASNPDLMSEAEGGTLKTPLHLACERGDLELVALLLAHGADTAARVRHQLTPLFAAVKRNAAKVVRLLLHSGGSQADPPPPPDRDGQTCLFSAAKYQRVDVLRFLAQEKSANINVHNRRGRTPLHSACAGGAVPALGMCRLACLRMGVPMTFMYVESLLTLSFHRLVAGDGCTAKYAGQPGPKYYL